MIFLYRPLYRIAKFLLQIFYFLLPEHLKIWIQRRNSKDDLLVPLKSKSLWFHASSGEVEYVKNIITEIKKLNPNQKIVLTYSSPSIEKLLGNIKHQLDLTVPLPWDQPGQLKKMIALLNPKLLIFAKTDFWPELIYQAEQAQIPMGVVSFSLNTKSSAHFLQKWVFKKLKFIFVSDQKTADKLKSQRIDSIVASDTRFDQVFFRLEQPSKFNFHFKKPVITFGSTWPEDDAILLTALPALLQKDFQIVWCPHDVSPNTMVTLKEKLKSQNFIAYSALGSSAEIKNDILVIDQVGLLADIYRQSEFAFIGGSFREKIHSVMEALCAGCLVFFGPYYKNNSEALEFLESKLAFQFDSAEQFLSQIQSLTQNSKAELKAKIKEITLSKKGSSKKIAEYLLT